MKWFLAALSALLAAATASAAERKVAIIVGRRHGAEPSATKGLALKLGVEAQRRGLSQIVPPASLAGVLRAEDDPFLSGCVDDDECLFRLAATIGQPTLLLAIIDGPAGRRRGRLVFVDAESRILLRRARELPEPFERSVEQESMAALELGLARLPGSAGEQRAASAGPADAARKVARLWRTRCSICHGIDGKAQTVMGLRLGLASMADAGWQKKIDDGQIEKAIVEGSHSGEMRSYKDKYTPEQIRALVEHVRSLRK